MAMAHGTVESYYDDQMVVAVPDLPLVEQSLAQLNVVIRHTRRHALLGLALLGLEPASITRAVAALLAESDIGPDLTTYRNKEATRLGQLPVSNLDLLLKALRLYFRVRYPFWTGPRMGKNRGIDNLSGAPEIGPGGVGDPLSSQTPLAPRVSQRVGGRFDQGDGRGVRIGQIDGSLYPHPWLAGGYLAAPDDQVPSQDAYSVNQGHAASVASCILAVAPAAEIHLRRVLGQDGKGDMWFAATQMAELAHAGCDVVNVSVGQCFTDDGNPPLVLDTAVRMLSARSIVIAAAGNHGNVTPGVCPAVPGLRPDSVFYPAGCEDAIAVGALDQDGKVAPFNPQDAPYIRLMASGTGVTVAYLNGEVTIKHHCQNVVNRSPFAGWATVSGTSYAAAIVSGEIARRTVPGRTTAREALDQLLRAHTPIEVPNPQGGIIRPA